MRRSRLWMAVFCASVCASVVVLAGSSRATHPNIQRQYRFISRVSTLTQSNTIAGGELELHVVGTFDLSIGHHAGDDPTVYNSARFLNVDAWGFHPLLDLVVDVDAALNLSGLKGEQLPVAAPFDVFHFTGHKPEPDNSAVSIFARVIGPWLYLNGETTPPPQSADVPVFKLDAVARTWPFADFFDDSVVDHRDLEQWASHYGLRLITDPSSQPYGDADGDHDADGADFLEWQRQLGEVIPPPLPSLAALLQAGEAGAATIPEPQSLALASLGAGLLMFSRRR